MSWCSKCNAYHVGSCPSSSRDFLRDLPKIEPIRYEPILPKIEPILPQFEPIEPVLPKIEPIEPIHRLAPSYPTSYYHDRPGAGGPLDAGFHYQQVRDNVNLPYFKFGK